MMGDIVWRQGAAIGATANLTLHKATGEGLTLSLH